MNEKKQYFHFGMWDYAVFVTSVIALCSIIKMISKAVISYFESNKTITLEEVR